MVLRSRGKARRLKSCEEGRQAGQETYSTRAHVLDAAGGVGLPSCLARSSRRLLSQLLTRWLLPLTPILLFAGMLALLQWVAGMPVTWLWLKTILVCLATTAVVRFLPWDRWLFRLGEGTFLFQVALFALFVRHFAFVLLAEGRRALIARSLSVPRRYGAGWFRSLAFAVGAFFTRSVVRAERFYAGQWVRGIGE